MRPWGMHLLVDGRAAANGNAADAQTIRKLFAKLVEALDVRPYGDLIIDHFGHADPMTSGYSAVQLIEESSLTGHFVDATGDFYLDLFSCKMFDAGCALDVITRTLCPQAVNALLVGRDAAEGPYVAQRVQQVGRAVAWR